MVETVSTPKPPPPGKAPAPSGLERLPAWAVPVILLAVVGPLYFWNLGGYGMWDPWETHYGEVARRMARGNPAFYDITKGRMVTARPPDWMSPRWGFARGEDPEDFFSKPIWIFWAEAASFTLFGVNELSVRLPHVLVSCFALALLALAIALTVSRRAGLLAGFVLAMAPQWFLISRQAVTDMPFVGLVTAGLAFFLMGLAADSKEQVRPWQRWLFAVAALGSFLPQLLVLVLYFPPFPRPSPVSLTGVLHAVFWIAAATVVGATLWKERRKRSFLLFGFYICVAHATMAKGMLGFLLPGAIILTYILATRRWGLLKELEIPRGIAIFCCVAFPWYAGMIAGHGRPYVTRFIIQDHFQRLGTRIHGTYGTFAYFFQQLGYAMFPWIGLVPAALAFAFARVWTGWLKPASASVAATEGTGASAAETPVTDRGAGFGAGSRTDVRLFFLLWALVAYAVFSLSVTKFHHYILPALPGFAVLVALFVEDVLSRRVARPTFPFVIALGVTAVVAFDIAGSKSTHLRRFMDLFVYNYDRTLPNPTEFPGADFKTLFGYGNWSAAGYLAIMIAVAWGVAALGAALQRWGTRGVMHAGLAFAGIVTVLSMVWLTQDYIMMLSPHWSQRDVIRTYYELRSGPDEHLVAWEMRWRGENFYTENECEEFEKGDDVKRFYDRYKTGRHFFMMERGRFSRFKATLPTAKARESAEIVEKSSDKFYLVKVDF